MILYIFILILLYKGIRRTYRWYQRRRAMRSFVPYVPYVRPIVPVTDDRRRSFDRETQLAATNDPEWFMATWPQTGGPMLLDAPAVTKPPRIIITAAQARALEEFVPDSAIPAGRWLWLGEWPEGWEEESE